MKKIIWVILVIMITGLSFAEGKETKLFPIPIFGSSPETGFLLGGVGAYYEKSKDNKLNVSFGGMYTQKKQSVIFLQGASEYKKNKTFFEMGISNWLSDYYGIGSNTKEKDPISYEFEGYEIKVGYLNNITNSHSLGYNFKYEDYNFDLRDNINYDLKGSEGENLESIGIKYNYDTRNNEINTKNGSYFDIEANIYTKDLSEYKFLGSKIEIKKFRPITKNSSLGLHGILELKKGDVPFQKLSKLGGDSLIRGFEESRFIDKNKIATQIEYRYPIYKRVRGVAFASFGEVFNGESIIGENLQTTYGAGIRYSISKEFDLNLRMDFAISGEGTAMYINVGEAF
ncbi:MAG: BamA/TamA family outer membrane protein [Fusobacteriota bacterium]